MSKVQDVAISILHTGQTGVERGAHRAAAASGLPISGFCPRGGRDELGVLPSDIRNNLTELDRAGARGAAYATVELADAVVIVLPDRQSPSSFTGIEALRRVTRMRQLPVFVVDAESELDELAAELRRVEARLGDLRLMVTGPRRTRWAEGERLGWLIVSKLALTEGVVGSRKRRVLVVEDDVPTATNLRGLLRVLGHECAAVNDGQSALDHAAELDPEIVLIDIRLPDMTGYDVARRLRLVQRRPLFLAAITGWERASDPRSSLEAGFDRHVQKPAGAEIIQALLEDADAKLTAAAG